MGQKGTHAKQQFKKKRKKLSYYFMLAWGSSASSIGCSATGTSP